MANINRMDITSVSSRGQVVIPEAIRKVLGVNTGTKMFVFTDGNNVLLKPLPNERLTEFKNLIQASQKFAKQHFLQAKHVSKLIKQTRYASST
ncbi:MAG: AbrB/MazE/SpoVT family DNA-binding domain-containing protein [Patescibacteria group bacterium]|jgi:antitoxin PrlF